MSMTPEELRQQDGADDQTEDNGFVNPANDDASEEPTEAQVQEAMEGLTHDQKLRMLEEVVIKHPLNREVMYLTLAACNEERLERDLEEEMATFPQFASCTQNQYRLIATLVKARGLRRIERNQDGDEIFPEEKEGLTEDQIDDLVYSISYESTDLGKDFVRLHNPKARLIELLGLKPERSQTYVDVLEFVAQQPRSYDEIKELLRDSPALEVLINDHYVVMQPSVFVDKLERNGALVWNNGWALTKEGEEFLQELKAQQ